MAEHSPSGEIVLSSLLDYVGRRESDVVRGKVTLKLHPRALEYLASRLQVLDELEELRQSSPVEFFRGAFTDLDDYTRLQKLHHILTRTQSVRVIPTVSHLRDPTRVNLLPFQALTRLELRGCDLSTSAWVGLANIQQVESLTCLGCLEELHHLLAPFSHVLSMQGDRSTPLWPNLTSLHCKQNSFERLDSSLNLPALRLLDLSNNNITVIQNLHLCTSLTDLNLSYNNIQSLAPLREVAATLRRLVLQGNAVRTVRGLQNLVSLTELDLRCNLLASYQEFSLLNELRELRSLWLEGNPLSYAPFYRLDVLAWFDLPQLVLDGMVAKSSESTAVAMRATGEVPLAWQIMAQYVSQRQLLWRPREAVTAPRAGVLWRASSVGLSNTFASPQRRPSSGSRHGPSRGRLPARRIVEFSGDPLAALDSALERPPSPSPFEPAKEDSVDSASQTSSVYSSRLPMLRSMERMSQQASHTIYRNRSGAAMRPPLRTGAEIPAYNDSILQRLQQVNVGANEGGGDGSESESSSLDTASSREPSLPTSPVAARSTNMRQPSPSLRTVPKTTGVARGKDNR